MPRRIPHVGVFPQSRDRNGWGSRHRPLPHLPGRGGGRLSEQCDRHGARGPRGYDGPARAVHQRVGDSDQPDPVRGGGRRDRAAHAGWRCRDRQASQDRQRLLRALLVGGGDGRVDSEGPAQGAAMRCIARG